MEYEINYLVLQSKTAELPEIRKEIKTLLASHGAEVLKEREYLKRKLAYEIKHEAYGFYTVLRFSFKDNVNIQELRGDLNINNNVSRYIIVKADELPALEELIATKEDAVEEAFSPSEGEKNEIEKPKAQKVVTAEEEKPKAPLAKKEKIQVAEEEKPSEEPVKEEKTPEKKPKKKAKEEDEEKNALDDLDKKLDEILNI